MSAVQSTRPFKIKLVIICLLLFVCASKAFSEDQKPKNQPNFFEDLASTFRPRIKYSPVDEPGIDPNALPYWLRSWKNFRQQMEDRCGTSIGIVLIGHHQQVLNGPGSREGRNIFWWNLTIKQKLWEDGKLIFKARGGYEH